MIKPIVMGIDFGLKSTMLLAFNNSNAFYIVKGAPRTRAGKLYKSDDNIYSQLDTYTYKTALYVVNIAFKHHASLIQMEDLRGTKFTQNSFFFELQRAVQYLAEEKGVLVRYVDRDFTSQKCSACGYIDKTNRTRQDTFSCKSCGFTIHADNNAAINIARC